MSNLRKVRKRETVDVQMEKGEKDEHLKLLTLPRTIYFTKIIENKL